jgi:steroid delta-isomerase-like uncharacterized protein
VTREEEAMSTERNKATVRKELEVFGSGNFAVLDELVADDYISHDPTLPEPIRGRDAYRAHIASLRAGLADLQVRVDDQVADGDTVVTRWTATARHEGDLFGIAPTGRAVTITGISIERFHDGRIVEDWAYWDALGLMRQLGVVPEPAVG